MAKTTAITPNYIFTASWEVCNKVGGIYTVLSTQARALQAQFSDHLIYIGPDFGDNPDFAENKTLWKAWKKQVAETEGLPVRVGRWNVPGKPLVVLVDFKALADQRDSFFFWMWENFGIDSTRGYGDYDEACIFSFAASKVIETLYAFLKLDGQPVVAHLHEWTLAPAVLYLNRQLPTARTVFTTHATTVGRSISSNNKPLYDQFSHYNGDQMAWELNVTAKHRLEKTAAHTADCFTTVSEITARECVQLLEKQPDVVTPNGFEPDFVPQGEAFDAQRSRSRKLLLQVAGQLTGATLPDDTLLLATSGRYEYRNKGLDVFIEAIHRVRQSQPQRQMVAFLLVPAGNNGPRADLQQRLQRPKKKIDALYAPYLTHELTDPYSDKICEYLHHLNFTNQEKEAVKIIFVPSYLNGKDGIFNRSYYELLAGFDLTVFPSYYEPWGYTPLESIAFGIPTVTTTLSGFGAWVERVQGEGCKVKGEGPAPCTVLSRNDSNYFEVAEAIKDLISDYARQPETELNKTKKAAQTLSKKADWAHFIQACFKAYKTALKQ